MHHVEQGAGRPVLVLHGAGVDHREPEACFEPFFGGVAGFRRIYPDLPGMGRTVVPDGMRSAEDVLDTLLDFVEQVTDARGRRGGLLVSHWFARCCRGCAGSCASIARAEASPQLRRHIALGMHVRSGEIPKAINCFGPLRPPPLNRQHAI